MPWRRAILAAATGVLTVGVCGAAFAIDVWGPVQETVARLVPASAPDSLYAALADGITFAVGGTPGVLLAVGLILASRRFAWRPNRCRQCGYNLTDNTSGRCPECGTEAA